jgi:signal transduction histidine kinase
VISHGDTISEEEQAKLFEAFTRGNNAQNISGSGLGLELLKEFLNITMLKLSILLLLIT